MHKMYQQDKIYPHYSTLTVLHPTFTSLLGGNIQCIKSTFILKILTSSIVHLYVTGAVIGYGASNMMHGGEGMPMGVGVAGPEVDVF